MSRTVGSVTAWLAGRYPPELAEEWDRVGLSVGDPDAAVDRVLLTVDVTDAVVEEAIGLGAQLIVSHHPLLLRGLHAVRTDQPKGRLVARLLRAGVAVVSAHTNADAAEGGVADALADVLGLTDRQPLVPRPAAPLDKVVTFVPPTHAEAVLAALADAGAGRLGDYEACAFTATGEGHFTPLEGADPYLGRVGQPERTPEVRVEMVLPRHRREAVVAALRAAHPYEEPAFDVLELAGLASSRGLGRVGSLAEPTPASEVARRLASRLPTTTGGVRLGGDPHRVLSRVAVLGGAGDSLLDAARAAGVDCYVTGDLRHHPAQDFLAHADAPVLLDVPHWAAEWTWLPALERELTAWAGQAGEPLATSVSTINTDPWSARYGAGQA